MIPNKPSVLAPNGSGKSSFAFAFQWLNRLRMKLNEEDAYMGDVNNKPSMVIETVDPDMTLTAWHIYSDIIILSNKGNIERGMKHRQRWIY